MYTHNSIFKNLLLTASLVSTAAFLTACGDSDKGSGNLVQNVARQDLVSDVAQRNADRLVDRATTAARRAGDLQPSDPSAETPEQKAARETAEAEAERLRVEAEEAIKKAEEEKRKEEAAREALRLEALKERLKAMGKAGPMGIFKEKLGNENLEHKPSKSVNIEIRLRALLKEPDSKVTSADELAAMTDKIMDIVYKAPTGSPNDFKIDGKKADEALVRKAIKEFLKGFYGFVDAGDAAGDVDGADLEAVALTEEQVDTSVGNLRNAEVITGAFEDVELAPMVSPMGGSPIPGFLMTVDAEAKKALINAKVDGDYGAFIDLLKGNAAINAHVPDDKKLAFAKALQKRAIAKTLAPAVELALSSGSIKDLSGNVSFRDARTSLTGRVDGRGFAMNGVNGQAVDLNMPLFVNLKGDVNGAKATEAATGSVAYRLGNTVIGAIQGYANSGAGFGFEGRQLESSVVASHSFGGLFLEGQAGSVSAANVHNSDWSGYRSLLTVGFDTSFVSPFVQISHRQLDRDGVVGLNETAGYVGLDVDVANLAADTYSVNTRLLAKVGYGEQAWSNGSKDLGSTSGVRSSVEWTAGVNLNSGISFSTNLGLNTLTGSSAGLKVSLDR